MLRLIVSFVLFAVCTASAQPNLLNVLLATNMGSDAEPVFPESAFGVAFDSYDNMWVCGDLPGPVFPFPEGATAPTFPGEGDIFVMYLVVGEDNEGSRGYTLVQTLIIGGSSFDSCGEIVITPDDEIFIAGRTRSTDFPGLRNQLAGNFDWFVAKLEPSAQALRPAPSQGNAQLGPHEVAFSMAFGGPGNESFRDIGIRNVDGGVELYLIGESNASVPLGPGQPDHPARGDNDVFVLRIDDELNLIRGAGFGGPDEEFLGEDVSIDRTVGRFTGAVESRVFEGLQNPGPSFSGMIAEYDLDTLATQFELIGPPDGQEIWVIQRHAFASARHTPDGAGAIPRRLLLYGTARTPAPTFVDSAIVMDAETKELLHTQPDATARGMHADSAGTVHFAFFGRTNGNGRCTQNTSGAVGCVDTTLVPDPGGNQFVNSMATNSAGQLAYVGQDSLGLTPVGDALQPAFGGPFDAFIVDTQQVLLLGLANAAFNGEIGPGDLVTAFGEKIGPRKDAFATSNIVSNALETNVEGVQVNHPRLKARALMGD